MKVIFLDVDGVLNCTEKFKSQHLTYKQTGFRPIEIDIDKVQLLKKLVEDDCKNTKIGSQGSRDPKLVESKG